MSSPGPHDRIIKTLCREILLPIGVFQKGASRVYLDDNGWYFTMIEFQPSGFSQGTYLNIGLDFLFRREDYFAFCYADGTGRIGNFVPYENDDQFEREVRPYVERAREHALKYRAFRNLETAKQAILRLPNDGAWRPFYQAMICLMTHDEEQGRQYYTDFLESCDARFKAWIADAGYPMSAEGLDHDCAMSLIRRKRTLLHSKSSMKKMPAIGEFE